MIDDVCRILACFYVHFEVFYAKKMFLTFCQIKLGILTFSQIEFGLRNFWIIFDRDKVWSRISFGFIVGFLGIVVFYELVDLS